ncbi:MAG TPA: hypothetical protein VHD76_12325 [Bryobacteraceae bacterium]|nr:hypothetical protein [Bryobacteraceae bacterium]HWB96385.1 hypothetical protein [Bryobacteraceae bacterium]
MKTTVCELLAKPEQFSGKVVVFQADLINPRRMALKDGGCERVLLTFPKDPDTKPKAKFNLVEDESYKKLMASVGVLVPMPPKKPGRITATFEGRFDSVFILHNGQKVQRDPRSLRLAADEVRLVLRKVSDVRVLEPTQASGASNPDQLQHEMQHAAIPEAPEKKP